MATQITPPVQQFFDLDGHPLDGGKIYIGEEGQNPTTHPISIYWDAESVYPAPNPIETLAGYPSRNGTIARIFANVAKYSMAVYDKKGRLIFSFLSSSQTSSMILGESQWLTVDTTDPQALVATTGGTIDSYAAGMTFTLKTDTDCAGATTIAIDGLAAKNIYKRDNWPLAAGDYKANWVFTIVYDGDYFLIVTPTDYLNYLGGFSFQQVSQANGYKLEELGNATADDDAMNLVTTRKEAYKLVGSVSGTNTITGSCTPALTAYTAGMELRLIAVADNTGAVTINIDSLGAKSVTKRGTIALQAGDILNGEMLRLVYDGTRFQIVGGKSQETLGTAQSSTSGTSIEFTGIPLTATRITVSFERVSLSGTDNLVLQIGGDAGYMSASYYGSVMSGTSQAYENNGGVGARLTYSSAAATTWSGQITLTKIADNLWAISGILGCPATSTLSLCGYSKEISGGNYLTKVRIVTTGANTFDGGGINISYI